MKHRKIGEILKNATGAMFLVAAAFFVCSTFISMRSVLADPIAPTAAPIVPQLRAPARSAATARTSPRSVATRQTVARTAATNTATGTVVSPSRATTTSVSPARSAPVPNAQSPMPNARGVSARAASPRTVANRVTASRAVVARTGTNAARVSLTGSAMRAPSGGSNSQYTYLQNRLYTGNYSNIVDPSTGLIAADAYANCMESYYTCMDEICTARNQAQRRCGCAGRVKAFAQAEQDLEVANEQLIKVSGELALLIATKGKDVSSAFTLTDAEQVMNCVSWKEASNAGTAALETWCTNHHQYDKDDKDGKVVANCSEPEYCTTSGNNFGFELDNLNVGSSDILAQLQGWAAAKEAARTINNDDNSTLVNNIFNMTDVIGGLTGDLSLTNDTAASTDSLARTWGYDLFEYAHNNVCNRVLDSCFNGIYETCATGACDSKSNNAGSSKYGATNGSSCQYNYSSVVQSDSSGSNLGIVDYKPGNASCFGYTTTSTTTSTVSTDPYSSLRAPVANARRSILNKYLLDANADCDLYGEQLRQTAQNIGYQKAAAQQALQQKRLEFAQAETADILAKANAAATNFSRCLSDILDCYETAAKANESWSTSRVKTYCAQIANIPTCYDTMICNPSTNQFKAVIDVPDSDNCSELIAENSNTQSACRNVVTLNEIISGISDDAQKIKSAGLRENCLTDVFVEEIREWDRDE